MDFSWNFFGVVVFILVCKSTTNQNVDKSQVTRSRRAYYPLSNSAVLANQPTSFTTWKAPVYQLSRPYFIPVFGAPGRIPIYFPPQPLFNPGVPPDNPVIGNRVGITENPNVYQGPTYLPPSTEKMPNLTDKFGSSDDRPVWNGNRPTTMRPLSTRPTRLPLRPTTLPPLIHNQDSQEGSSMDRLTQAPATSRPTTTTRRPTTTTTQAPSTGGPSACVWAIVNCCSVSTSQIVESCFEQRGCPGPFWGSSPCDSDFARAALASALNYYNTNS